MNSMKLTMKEKKFSIRDSFTIKDEEGMDKYKVIGEFIDTGTLHIKDMSGREVASISEKLISLKKRFYLNINGERVGEIVKDMSLFGAKYHITGLNWEFKGNISDHKYSIVQNKKTIATVKRKRIAFTGTYIFDIEDENNEIAALAVILAMDYLNSH